MGSRLNIKAQNQTL